MARWRLRRRDTEMLEARRHEAIDLLDGGASQAAVARALGVSAPAISYWLRRYRAEGRSGLRARPRRGRPPRVPREHWDLLSRLLTTGARSHGFPSDEWTVDRLSEAASRTWRIRYTRAGLYAILRKQGARWTRALPGAAPGARPRGNWRPGIRIRRPVRWAVGRSE